MHWFWVISDKNSDIFYNRFATLAIYWARGTSNGDPRRKERQSLLITSGREFLATLYPLFYPDAGKEGA